MPHLLYGDGRAGVSDGRCGRPEAGQGVRLTRAASGRARQRAGTNRKPALTNGGSVVFFTLDYDTKYEVRRIIHSFISTSS